MCSHRYATKHERNFCSKCVLPKALTLRVLLQLQLQQQQQLLVSAMHGHCPACKPTWVNDAAAHGLVLDCLQLVCWQADCQTDGIGGLELSVETKVQCAVDDSCSQGCIDLRTHGG